jgi:hypothetical protein
VAVSAESEPVGELGSAIDEARVTGKKKKEEKKFCGRKELNRLRLYDTM